MADLAVGLSKSVVEGALTKVQSAIEQDAKLRQKAKRDLVFITLELEMMQSFLDDANEEMVSVKKNLVRTWVKHIRQLAYDVEDCVENVVHLDDKPIFWRRLLPACLAPVLPLDVAVEELDQLKGRVEDVNNCYRRYSLINDYVGSKPANMSSGTATSKMLTMARAATKRQRGDLPDLTQLITRGKGIDLHLQVISVWSSGGDDGAISIIRKTYNDPQICKNFAYRSWVKPTEPFNPFDFVCKLMPRFYASSCGELGADIATHVLTKMEATSPGDLFRDFQRLVSAGRYLVILEGLPNMLDWDAIRTLLPDTMNGSWIIVSTQQPEVASLCVGNPYQILELEQFSDEHSVCVLFTGLVVNEANQNSSNTRNICSEKSEEGEGVECQPLLGRESQITELRSYLLKARFSSSQVVSVWGMAGVGKSFLVRRVYFDRTVHTDRELVLFDKYTWADVSHPFNIRNFARSLLLDFDREIDPIKQCRHLLEHYKCLVVIDGLRSKEEWDKIQAALLSGRSASVIIVITTEASVAAYCTNDEEQMLNVQCLEADAAFDFFRKEVHKKNPSSPLTCNRNVEVEDLILKCGGIPRVIAGIAGLLATKTHKWMDTVRSLNQRFMHHLEIDREFDSLQSLFLWMHSIILNPPDFLKPCIFYLSIFPRDCHIRQRRLLRRWIAEGYSKESVRHAEENVKTFFSELVQLSIFKKVDTATSGGMVFYLVNAFIREYIASRQTEENLVFELGGGRTLTTQSRGRHLVVLTSWDRDSIVYESIDFSRLWSLTVFGEWKSFFISENMKLLRVLDLEDASGVKDSDLEKMVKLLRHLKFLSLRGCNDIYHLPSSIGDLRRLQTLDVRGTSIVTLPGSITKLNKLQYIRAGGTTLVPASTPPPIVPSSSCLPHFCRSSHRHLAGVKVPGGIERLKALHTLGVINVATSAFLKDLKKLTQLRKLGVCGINGQNSKEFVSAMSGHDHLESLSVRLDKSSQGFLDGISLPWDNLQSLKLYGLVNSLPLPVPRNQLPDELLLPKSQLSRLTKLVLEMDTLMENDIEFLAMLPELCILRLRVQQQLLNGKLHFHAQLPGEQLSTFKKVKILEIACSTNRLHVTFGSSSMGNLELLKIDSSSGSYQGLNYLSELKQVLLKGTDDETKIHLESQLANHPKRPIVKLENDRVRPEGQGRQ